MVTCIPEAEQLPRSVLGLVRSCYVGDVATTAEEIVARAREKSGGYVCLCNVHLLTLALHEPDIHDALGRAWKRLPDGEPVAWLQRRIVDPNARRIPGPDLMPLVVDLGRKHELRHFLLGSTDDVAGRVHRSLSSRYPGARIIGRHSPPFRTVATVEPAELEAIDAAQPDIVWCALGAPKQERWMDECCRVFPNVLFMGVGAAFDFLADRKQRAPEWMRDRGLEWLHRLASEPRRLGSRYFTTNTEFVIRSGLELTRRRLST